LELDGFEGEIVKATQDRDLEHQDDVVGFSAGGGFPLLLTQRFQGRPKSFPVDYGVKLDERVAGFVELVESLMAIKEAGLHHDMFLPWLKVRVKIPFSGFYRIPKEKAHANRQFLEEPLMVIEYLA